MFEFDITPTRVPRRYTVVVTLFGYPCDSFTMECKIQEELLTDARKNFAGRLSLALDRD